MKFALIVYMLAGTLNADGTKATLDENMMSMNQHVKPKNFYETREECYRAGRLSFYQNYPGSGKDGSGWFMTNSETREFRTFTFECREIESINYKQ